MLITMLGCSFPGIFSATTSNITASAQPGITLAQTPTMVVETEENGIYDIQADFAKSWKAGKNPYGAWKFGWSDGLVGNFELYTDASISPIQNQRQEAWNDPRNLESLVPDILLNVGPDYNDGNVDYKHGALLMHGGGKGWSCYSHAIWTAPAEGVYSIDIIFVGQQTNVNADAHVHVNGESCFNEAFTVHGAASHYTQVFYFHAGGTVDIAVGPNGEFTPHPGFIQINAVIQKLAMKPKAMPDAAPIPAFNGGAGST